MRRVSLFCLTFCVLLIGLAGAFGEPPADLLQLQGFYEQKVKELTDPVNQKYLEALQNMKKAYIAKGDEQAVRYLNSEIDAFSLAIASPGANSARTKGGAPSPASDGGASSEESPLVWRGDFEPRQGETGPALAVAASPHNPRIVHAWVNTEGKATVVLRLRYRSSDYQGQGLQLRGLFGQFPEVQYSYSQPQVLFDGTWRDAQWTFTEVGENKEIRFEVVVMPGEGEIEFADLQLQPQ